MLMFVYCAQAVQCGKQTSQQGWSHVGSATNHQVRFQVPSLQEFQDLVLFKEASSQRLPGMSKRLNTRTHKVLLHRDTTPELHACASVIKGLNSLVLRGQLPATLIQGAGVLKADWVWRNFTM